ncbi:DUF192 domain-containing protein [Capnocytophaga stomatis]|uniref:DUF192 domain-containing protein n=1 Tax=Capnocytophaga stomatis TaxID=1848904 RepID=A0ABW8QDD4_9FLAO|nr:DUF192 domain-containing protein [Capnocytophaga stomatis]GIJ94166.1 hypothetical protein CAPN002_13840 [Capnocytophaga stomatis]
MNFFRKYFVHLALGLVGLAALAYVLPVLFSSEEKKVTFQETEIKAPEIEFTREAELSIFKNGNLLKKIDVEFADTPEETSLGLMYRKGMDENQGMLFIFPEEEMRSFYMKNTEFPLDIIYLDAQKQVVSIAKRAKPYDETSLPSEKPAMYVLEINGGLSDKWGIEAGDTITFEKIR